MLSLLFFPLFLLNFAGIVGGIWLVFLGEWKIVVAYTIGSLLATFFLGSSYCQVHGYLRALHGYSNVVGGC
jgi:hypothetical protein